MTRRAVLMSGAAAGLAPLLGRPAGAEEACKVTLKPFKGRPEKAVSLRSMSSALASNKPVRWEGFTRLDGYVIDDDIKDVVLYGGSEPGQPELQPADFVVALRARFKSGVDPKDGTDYNKSAAISIDPDPEIFHRLHDIQTSTPDGRRQYAELCKSPQTVRVDGFQRHTRVAKILVDADYKMKRISQGIETLAISSPFPGDFEAKIREWRSQINSGRNPAGSPILTRYWFTPGRFSYGEATDHKNMVRFGFTQVVLKDEDQIYSAGKDIASGRVNEYARAFTCSWTERMEDTFSAEPIWQEMRNMFRHFALTRVMRDLGAFEQVGLDIAFLLDRYEVPRIEMPATLPGISRLEVASQLDGGTTWTYANTVCGGVDVGFNKPVEQDRDNDGDILYASRNVLGARPAPTAIAWNVTPGMLKTIEPRSPTTVRVPAETGKSRSLDNLFKTPSPTPAPAPSGPRSLQDLFKT
jgi:hypothetical protein